MILTEFELNPLPSLINPTSEIEILLNPYSVDLFDQNGYNLTESEQSFCKFNNIVFQVRRHEKVIRNPWFVSNKRNGVHINHSDLFERKSYSELALEQLKVYSKNNPMLFKLINLKSKWGIDLSLDYVSEDRCFEVFPYELNSFEFNRVYDNKKEIKEF